MRKLILTCGFIFSLVHCAHSPTAPTDQAQEGQWRAKALVKDLEQSRSYIVNLNFNARRGDITRMDVSSTFGTGVASLVADQNEVRYVIFDQKKFYSGQPQPTAMRPILALPFDPRWLQNLLFRTPLPADSWECHKDDKGELNDCVQAVSGLKVTWGVGARDKRTVRIEHTRAIVQINFQSFRPKVEERANLFSLEAPQGFQKIRVR